MITTNNITKKYGDFTAIDDLSFNVFFLFNSKRLKNKSAQEFID